MPVTSVAHDIDARTVTITAEFAAPIDRVWQVYADPRQLEKVWGPPSFPATVVDHDLTPGGLITYFMTGPEGEKFGGYMEIREVDAPNGFTFVDGFANEDLTPNDDMPVSTSVYSFKETGGRTVATYVSTYETAEGLQQVLEMGVEEGSRTAIEQIDDLLAA